MFGEMQGYVLGCRERLGKKKRHDRESDGVGEVGKDQLMSRQGV